MGPGPDGPMGAMGAMEPHHMNGSLGGFQHCVSGQIIDGQIYLLKKQLNYGISLLLLPQGPGIWMGCQR